MVNAKLAACANIISGIQSIYRWKGKVVKAQEVLLILKSTKPRYRALEKRSRRCIRMKLLKLSHCRLRKALINILGGCIVRPTANWVLKEYF